MMVLGTKAASCRSIRCQEAQRPTSGRPEQGGEWRGREVRLWPTGCPINLGGGLGCSGTATRILPLPESRLDGLLRSQAIRVTACGSGGPSPSAEALPLSLADAPMFASSASIRVCWRPSRIPISLGSGQGPCDELPKRHPIDQATAGEMIAPTEALQPNARVAGGAFPS